MATTQDIIELLNKFAPFEIAESWDNSGLQVGHRRWVVKKILIGLDVSPALMETAAATGVDLVLTHHPLIMNPEKQIDFSEMPGKAIEISAEKKISVVSAHTNLDKANAGLNDYFARQIGLTDISGVLTEAASPSIHTEAIGIGRIGVLPTEVSLEQLARHVKGRLNLNHIRVTGEMDRPVKTIAVCTGSGGSLVDDFLNSPADVYITGDIKYHEARKTEMHSKALIDVGHFGSERIAIDLLFEKLNQALERAGLDVELVRFSSEEDPFTIV